MNKKLKYLIYFMVVICYMLAVNRYNLYIDEKVSRTFTLAKGHLLLKEFIFPFILGVLFGSAGLIDKLGAKGKWRMDNNKVVVIIMPLLLVVAIPMTIGLLGLEISKTSIIIRIINLLYYHLSFKFILVFLGVVFASSIEKKEEIS